MSHVDQGPLPAYNSLTDHNLTGYFANTRMRSQLRRSGLITKRGEIVSENTYRLNMGRKEHKKHVKDMLAQAIVHKTLDLERSRQAEIRKKLEEIAKIELVRRVRSERQRITDENLLPFLNMKTAKAKAKQSGKISLQSTSKQSHSSRSKKGSHEPKSSDSAVHERASRDRKRENYVLPLVSPQRESCQSSTTSGSSSKPVNRRRATRSTGSPQRKGKRPFSALSSNYDDENETVVYLDDEGRPISPAHVDRSDLKYSSKEPIDTRHLYSLDTAALRKYAMLMAKMEQGRGGLASPYLIPQVPLPPKSPRSGRAPLSAQRQRSSSNAAKSQSPKRPSTAGGQAYLHPSAAPKQVRGQQETMCEVFMEYHGSSLSLVREQFDKRQDVIIEQQHCGGNTLTVFRDKMEAGTKFSFISYRHRGYPFSLSIYVDGRMDCRVSVCCEHRHSKGGRIGGKKGHFSISSITGAVPCYKCQVEKGIRVKSAAPRRKLKRPPQPMEEVTVVESARKDMEEVEDRSEPVGERSEEILVPVEDDDDKMTSTGAQNKSEADYDDDFDSSSASSSDSEKEGYIYNEAYTNERGSDDDEEDGDRRSLKDAENVIKVANRIIQASAIDADKETKSADDSKRGEQSKRRKKSKRGETSERNEDRGDDSNDGESDEESKPHYSSISSCEEDEDYYAYKERMMKKIKDQAKKKKKDRKSDDNGKDDHGIDSKDSPAKQVNGNVKKISSTSSALGQAEPVETGSGERGKKKNKTGKSGKQQTRGNKEVSGSDIRDTADEVSEIESEMAASPRKVESTTHLAGPVLDEGESLVKGQESEGKGKTSNYVEVEGQKVTDGVRKEEMNAGIDRLIVTDKEREVITRVPGEKGNKSEKLTYNTNKPEPKLVSVVNTEDVHETTGSKAKELGPVGQEFHMDIYPMDSVLRGEGDFDEKLPCEDEDNDRGIAEEDRKLQKSKGYGLREDDDDDDTVDVSRGNKWVNTTIKKEIEKDKVSKKSRHRVKRLKEELKHEHTTRNEIENSEYIDAGAGFVQGNEKAQNEKSDLTGKCQNTGTHFESETKSFPMAKTGENPFLNAQEDEEPVHFRNKSDSFCKRVEEADKRKAKYFNDLSPRKKVIRGVVGDDGSEGEDDETYSKINLLDGRADPSDTEMDTFGGKDYVLANGKQHDKSTKHCSFNLSYQNDDSEAEDKPEYRVLVNVKREGDREKSKIKAIKRQKKIEEMEEKKILVIEDTRGDGDSSESAKQDEDNIEVKVHHPQALPRKDNSSNVESKEPNDQSSPERFISKKSDITAYNHQFTEEPSPRAKNTKYPPVQTVPRLTGFNSPEGSQDEANAYSTDDDHSDNGSSTGDGSPEQNKHVNSNPEPWYRVPEKVDIKSEKFMGATEEIHRTKQVNNEEERYAKHQMAFRESPDVDNEVVKKTGGVVSVLTPIPCTEVVPEQAGILSFSVHKPGQRSRTAEPQASEKRTIEESKFSTLSQSKEKPENLGIHTSESVEIEKDQGAHSSHSNKFDDGTKKQEGQYQHVYKSPMNNEEKNEFKQEDVKESFNNNAKSVVNEADCVNKPRNIKSDEKGEFSDVEDHQDNVRRDSNYMADLSSSNLSESGGTHSSGKVTDGRSVKKKKRKDRKKAENIGGGVRLSDDDIETEDHRKEKLIDKTKKKTSKGRVAELQKEDRKYSLGSIPDVIITSVDESIDTKVRFDDEESEKDKMSNVNMNENEQMIDTNNENNSSSCVGDAQDNEKVVTKDEINGVEVVFGEDPNGCKLSEDKSNDKKAMLELRDALCDEDSSADDISGIDALIEALEDQLTDSQKERMRVSSEQTMPFTPVIGDGSQDDFGSSENSEVKEESSASMIMKEQNGINSSKINELNINDREEGTINAIDGSADKVETLVSIHDQKETEEQEQDTHQLNGSPEKQNSIDVTESESMEEHAKQYVSQLLASIQNMENLSGSTGTQLQDGSSQNEFISEKDPGDQDIDRHTASSIPDVSKNVKQGSDTVDGLRDDVLPSNVTEGNCHKDTPPSTPSTPSGRKSNLLANQDSEYTERRRQRKLTVSFDLAEDFGLENFQPKDARGVDKTTGKVDLNDSTDEEKEDKRAKTPTPNGRRKMKKKKKGEGRQRSGSSSSSSSSSSDSSSDTAKEESADEKDTKKEEDKEEENIKEVKVARFYSAPPVVRKSNEEAEEEIKDFVSEPEKEATAAVDKEDKREEDHSQRRVSVSSSSSSSSSSSQKDGRSSDDYSESNKEEVKSKEEENRVVDMGQENEAEEEKREESPLPLYERPGTSMKERRVMDGSQEWLLAEDNKDEEEEEEEDKRAASVMPPISTLEKDNDRASVASSSSASPSSSSGSATIHDKGPNTVNDPTMLSLDATWDGQPKQETTLDTEQQQETTLDTEQQQEEESGLYGEQEKEPEKETPKVLIIREDLNKKKDDSGSSSDSSSNSSSDESDSDKDTKKVEGKTSADVHQSESQPESDPEATHGGNDPDNVANGSDSMGSRSFEPVVPEKARPGSILPLLEASQTTLEIKGVTLNKSQVYEVAEFLEHKSGITNINLVNCGIDDDDVQKLMEALRQSSSNPVMLNLGLNPLTVESVPHILTACKRKPSIEGVLLQGTRLGDDGINTLVAGMIGQVKDWKMQGESMDQGIHELDLSDCKFGDQGALGVARLLTSAVDLDTLTLTHNHAISSDGWKVVGDALKLNGHLETLTLDHNYVGDRGIEYITEGLYDNASVTALDLNDVGMTDKGGKNIMELLKRNTYLLEITVMENKLSEEMADNIQRYISLNKASISPK